MISKATDKQISDFIKQHRGWSLGKNALKQEFIFKDFKEAFEFMNKISVQAEKINHHPEWCNSYNQVSISLTTHEAKGISERDFKLARIIEKILQDK